MRGREQRHRRGHTNANIYTYAYTCANAVAKSYAGPTAIADTHTGGELDFR